MVTPHHILTEKKCYPDGCMVFVWKCRLLDKGHACPKKYKHVGRNCFSCKQFFEEKYQQQPRLKISEQEYDEFLRQLEDLDYWLDSIVGRKIELEGTIKTVKPNFRAVGFKSRERYVFSNWLVVFESAHIGYDLFDDICFARLSEKTQARFRFSEGSHLLCCAVPMFDRGRLIFTRLHNIETADDGVQPEWDRADAEVAAATATKLNIQTEKCLGCRFGSLIDRNNYDRNSRSRSLLCLAGQRLPEECAYPLMRHLDREKS
jgi:hypothetical protein